MAKFKYTPAGQAMFDAIYMQAISKQIKIKHPDMPTLDWRYWETICYNLATIAAFAYEGYELNVDGMPLKKQLNEC